MAPARVQQTSGVDSSNASSVSATFASPNIAGNIIILAFESDLGLANSANTPTDTAGNTYVKITSVQVAAAFDLEIWAAFNIKVKTGNVVTVTDTNGGVNGSVIAEEWSGVSTIAANDGTSTNTGVASSTLTAGNIVTTRAIDVVWVAGAAKVGAADLSAGSGYSNFSQVNTASSNMGVCSQVTSVTGTYNGTETCSLGVTWAAAAVALIGVQSLSLTDTVTIAESIAKKPSKALLDGIATIDGTLNTNGDMLVSPPFTAATTSNPKWIDGTAAGSTTNKQWGWATANTSGGTLAAQYDNVLGFPCITLSGAGMSTSSGGASKSQEIVGDILSYTAGSIATSILTDAIPVIAGKSYTLTGDYYIQAISDITHVSTNLTIAFYDALGNRLQISSSTGYTSPLTTWTPGNVSATAPAGAVWAAVSFRLGAGGATDASGLSMTASWKNIKFIPTAGSLSLFAWSAGKILNETMAITDLGITRAITAVLNDTINLVEVFIKAMTRALSDTLSIAENFLPSVGKNFSETFTISDLGIKKAFTRMLTETLSIADSMIKQTGKILGEGFNPIDDEYMVTLPGAPANSYMAISGTPILPTGSPLTMYCRFKTNLLTNGLRIMTKIYCSTAGGRSGSFIVATSGELQFVIVDSSNVSWNLFTPANSIQIGVIYDAVGTWDPVTGLMTVYLNNMQVAQMQGPTSGVTAATSPMYYGTEQSTGSPTYFNGNIYAGAVWNRAMAAAEAMTISLQNIPIVGLRMWHRFSEFGNSSVTDWSGNGHTATLVNSPVWAKSDRGGALVGLIFTLKRTFMDILSITDLGIGRTIVAVLSDSFTLFDTLISKSLTAARRAATILTTKNGVSITGESKDKKNII